MQYFAPNYKRLADISGASGATKEFYFRPEGFKYTGIQYILNSGVGVLKVYGSLNPDLDATDHDWEDITNGVFSVASLTSSGVLADNAARLSTFSLIKIEVVSSGAYNYIILLKQV